MYTGYYSKLKNYLADGLYPVSIAFKLIESLQEIRKYLKIRVSKSPYFYYI